MLDKHLFVAKWRATRPQPRGELGGVASSFVFQHPLRLQADSAELVGKFEVLVLVVRLSGFILIGPQRVCSFAGGQSHCAGGGRRRRRGRAGGADCHSVYVDSDSSQQITSISGVQRRELGAEQEALVSRFAFLRMWAAGGLLEVPAAAGPSNAAAKPHASRAESISNAVASAKSPLAFLLSAHETCGKQTAPVPQECHPKQVDELLAGMCLSLQLSPCFLLAPLRVVAASASISISLKFGCMIVVSRRRIVLKICGRLVFCSARFAPLYCDC